jgi:hypothetical protein
LKFEIQVRSILQHAWAEIEHDLGYKSKQSVPKQIRRRFSRVAGLLELADAEFAAIRAELANYETRVPERIEVEPERVTIDKASVSAFLMTSRTVRRLDKWIADQSSGTVGPLFEHGIDADVGRLKYAGFETIAEVEQALLSQEKDIKLFVKAWMAHRDIVYDTVYPGISLFYLGYVLAAQHKDVEQVRDYLTAAAITPTLSFDDLAKEILTIYGEMRSRK